MAKSEQQRQKKLAKKRAKELKSQRELAQRRQLMNSLAGQMQWASTAPVYRCLIGDEIFGPNGMGVIFFARQLGDGRIAMMFLLIDAHCLGVKDAGGRTCTPGEFEQVLEKSRRSSTFRDASPARARKLTEDAIAYAQSIGFAPHPDYRKVAPLWGDVDPQACEETFTFGLDGKPSYFAGPYDDEARQNSIFRRLCQTVGEGNFHFTIGGPGMSGESFNFDFDSDFDSVGDALDDDLEPESPVIEGSVIEGSVSHRRLDGPAP